MKLMQIRIVFFWLSFILFMLLPETDFSQIVERSEDWKNIEMDLFSFDAPPDLTQVPFKGIDSAIWVYRRKDLELVIEYGRYAGKTGIDKFEENYIEQPVRIDNKKAIIVFFKFKDFPPEEQLHYVANVYFEQTSKGRSKLRVTALCKTPKEQKIAEKIFRSIKFKK